MNWAAVRGHKCCRGDEPHHTRPEEGKHQPRPARPIPARPLCTSLSHLLRLWSFFCIATDDLRQPAPRSINCSIASLPCSPLRYLLFSPLPSFPPGHPPPHSSIPSSSPFPPTINSNPTDYIVVAVKTGPPVGSLRQISSGFTDPNRLQISPAGLFPFLVLFLPDDALFAAYRSVTIRYLLILVPGYKRRKREGGK